MPSARAPLRALGSLQLVGYANNPSRVITELAFIADKHANALAEGDHSDLDAPLEVQFDEFMDGVNSRGRGTKARQRKMTVEQAAAVLLVTVQKGHCELIAKKDDPHTIDVIKILPEAKRILAAFLPKLRGYGDIPYDQQYRGAIALAKRHFFPKGKALTKKELMALLLQSYQEKRELASRCQAQPQLTTTLGTQTSLAGIDGSMYTEMANGESVPFVRQITCGNTVEISAQSNSEGKPNHDDMVDVEPASGGLDLTHVGDHDVVSVPEPAPAQLMACTPVAPRSFNPYMTPISNPRRVDHTATTPSLHDSPTPSTSSHFNILIDENTPIDEGVGELLQATATSQGRFDYYYTKFCAACQKMTFLEGQKEEIQRKFDVTKRKLDETEQHLREANADKSKLQTWVDKLRRRLDSIYKQLGLLCEMTDSDPDIAENEETMNKPSAKEDSDSSSLHVQIEPTLV